MKPLTKIDSLRTRAVVPKKQKLVYLYEIVLRPATRSQFVEQLSAVSFEARVVLS